MAFFNLPFGVRIAGADPIDGDRYIAVDLATRDSLVGSGREFDGLQVFVESDKTLYILVDKALGTWDVVGSSALTGATSPFSANTVNGSISTVEGDNTASGDFSFIAGGTGGTVNGNYSSIIGGQGGLLINSATGSTILGGTGITGTSEDTVYMPNAFAQGAISATTFYSGSTDLGDIISNLDVSSKYDKSGGTISGNVSITGNLEVLGTATTLNTEVVQTKDNNIDLNYSGSHISAVGGGITLISGQTDGSSSSILSDDAGDWHSNVGFYATNISGDTIYSGSTDLDTIIRNIASETEQLDVTRVQDGINTYTGGTDLNPTVNITGGTFYDLEVTGTTELNILSATTIYSGGTNMSELFKGINYQDTYTSSIPPATTSPGWTIPGGLTVGDVTGQTFSDFIDNYLFPTVFSTISVAKSVILSFTPSLSTVEVGTTLDPTLTATFNQGDIENGDGSSGPDLVGLANKFTFTGPGISTTSVVDTSTNPTSITTSDTGFTTSQVAFGSNVWNVLVNHDIGTGLYYDSKGGVDTSLDGSRVAGNVSDNSNTITGRYYGFYDTGILPANSSEVRTGTDRVFLNGSNNGSFTITIAASEPLVFFAVPAGKTATVLYVESSNADVTGSFSVTTFNVDDAGGNPVSYDVYTTTIGGGGYPSTANYSVTIN